ncbi:citrate (Si)-synthase [Elusimicrobiota bacterium]
MNSPLHNKLSTQIPTLKTDLVALIKEHGDKTVSQVSAAQVFGGMRGVKGLLCDTSAVEPDKGLIIRGIPIKDLTEKLPEEILYLLCTGEIPPADALAALQKELLDRATVPDYVWKVLSAMPKDSHPMAMLNTAVLVMEGESAFRKKYSEGMKKDAYWEPTLDDALTILGRMPTIAAGIYRMRYNKGDRIAPDKNLDWGANYAKMLGLPDPKGDFARLMRLYLTLHCDHEGGNVSAFTSFTVSSALSDLFYALSAGLNGLAGPLHGLANQECLNWILMVHKKFNGVPSDEDLKQFAWDTLKSGKVVPGYGHAVLRVTDPRFDAFMAFGLKNCADDPVFQIIKKVFDVVPEVLKQVKKIKDPWPNVDAISGSLLYKYGLVEFDYYTVLFAVSRALGICSQAVLCRAMGLPITRPKSVTTNWLKTYVTKDQPKVEAKT